MLAGANGSADTDAWWKRQFGSPGELPAGHRQRLFAGVDAVQLADPLGHHRRPSSRAAAGIEPARLRGQRAPGETAEILGEYGGALVAGEGGVVEAGPLLAKPGDSGAIFVTHLV